jgi:hypothetical protein
MSRRIYFPAVLAVLTALPIQAATLPYRLTYADTFNRYNWESPISGGFDANGDGRSDLIVPDFEGPPRLYLSLGNGRFERKNFPFWVPRAQATKMSVTAGRYDSDLRTDFAYTDGNAVQVVTGLGGGHFRHRQTITPPTVPTTSTFRIGSGDTNGDGYQDLVVLDRPSDGTSSGASVMRSLGRADGSFDNGQTRIPTASEGWHLLVADITGDNRADVLVGNQRGEVSLSRFDANTQSWGLISLLQYDTGISGSPELPHARGLTSGDINNDTLVDAIVGYHAPIPGGTTEPRIRLLRNNGNGLELAGAPIKLPCYSYNHYLRLGDYDGDNITDILFICSMPSQPFGILFGRGNFQFSAAVLMDTSGIDQQASAVALARSDYNGDGRLDIAVLTSIGFRVYVYDAALERIFADGFQ